MIWIGAYGWDHDSWRETFYPPDLPPEWRLGFYANAFTAVIVPATVWEGLAPDTAAGWLEDTPPAFRFFLEYADGSGEPEILAASAALLGERLGGFVAAGRAGDVPNAASERLCRLAPFAVWGDLTVTAPGYDVCGVAGAEGGIGCRGPGRLVLARCPEGADPAVLRGLFEQLAATGAAEALLWCGAGPEVPGVMGQARLVAELMGL